MLKLQEECLIVALLAVVAGTQQEMTLTLSAARFTWLAGWLANK